MARVLLGMSGGVDSTVAALLLRQMGHEVCGITFIVHSSQDGAALLSAKAAKEVGIEHHVIDLKNEFEQSVIAPFVDTYLSGETPNPCVLCNRSIKFPHMLSFADEHGFEFISTGHYASVRQTERGYCICAAADAAKDQTYFLYTLGQDTLSRLILPLSGMTKDQVRSIAQSYGFFAAESKDSQDVCFIPDGDHTAFLRAYTKKSAPLGDFVDLNGAILGKHRGITDYTVGQRKGLGVSSTHPLYVKSIDAKNNRIILCANEELYEREILARDCVFAAGDTPPDGFRADVRIRYTKKSAPASLFRADGGMRIVFDEPQRAPAPGQSAVFFDGEMLIGGGIIIK